MLPNAKIHPPLIGWVQILENNKTLILHGTYDKKLKTDDLSLSL
jgi:hypothetical protein